MFGSILIKSQNGCSCSNDVTIRVERDTFIDTDGQKKMKHTNTLIIKGIFGAELVKDEQVECLFKIDETNKIDGFIGIVQGKTAETVQILIKSKTERKTEILKKIKEEYKWQHQ
jgi:hypothetical protein